MKCVYTDKDFYALIVSATDPEHGLTEADGYELVDHEGRPYEALPERKYTIQVEMYSADGKELASSSEEIEIGRTDGTIIHEITNDTAIKKGGMDLLTAWAEDENLTILSDLLPGFFGTKYQMSTLPMSVSCETAEYLPGKIKMLVYGNRSTSVSYALEMAKYLQLEHNVENPDIAEYYVFDLGEPSFAGEQARIVELADADTLIYTFTPVDGSDAFSIKKNIGVKRIDMPDGESKPALYEFYNVFPENTLKAENSYDVTIQAYDREGVAIKEAVCEFTIEIQK